MTGSECKGELTGLYKKISIIESFEEINMKKYCDKMYFRNSLNIFISSAMNDENGFAWKDMRKAVKKRLNECPLLNAFIIEDQCDPMPSMQYFKSQVATTDVVILLLKSTVRQGTCIEFDIVKKNHKKLFAYFIKSDDADLSIDAIKEELRNQDYCTYYEYNPESNEKLEDIIYNNVMRSLIEWYKFTNIPNIDLQDTEQEYTLANTSKKNDSLSKLILQNFNSCYGESFNILNIRKYNKNSNEKSKLHDIGIAMLNWLLTGSNFPVDDEIVKIVSSMKDLFTDTIWLAKRWDACKCMANNDFEQALKYESEALQLAEKDSLPEWVITDILIDCRNIANRACPFSGQEYQNRLSKTNELVYFPGLDRFCSNLFNDAIDEYQRESFKSRGEIRFGNNLNDIITEFENCLFISMLYGSYTHIVLAREALTKVLYHYGIIYNGNNFMFIATKLQILCGDSKKLEKIVNHEWGAIGSELIANADEIFKLAMQTSNNDIILTVIKIFMVYFNEESINFATRYMVNLSESMDYNIVNAFSKTINAVSGMMNGEDVVIILTNLLKQNILINYRAFTSTIIALDISGVKDEILCNLCNSIKNNVESIVRNNGNPQYISALIRQRKDIFNCLKDIPNNGLVNDELIFFEMNTDHSFDNAEKWQAVLCNQIEDINNQIQVNSQKGYYCEFATRPFLTIKNFVESPYCNFSDINQVINDKLIPICIQILKNNIVISLTEDCIECLISVVGKYRKSKLSIPSELIDYLMSSGDSKNEMEYTISLFNNTTPNNINYRYLMLKMLCKLDVKDELYYNYLNFSDKNETERIAISECLKEYFNINDVSDSILISLAFLLSNDSSSDVRMNACSCLYNITSNENYSNLSYLKLRELSSDIHPNVRYRLLSIYENNEVQKDGEYKDIISNLTNDAHYFIRLKAQELLS